MNGRTGVRTEHFAAPDLEVCLNGQSQMLKRHASTDWGRFAGRSFAHAMRKVAITFISQGNETKVVESFEAESTNPVEMQQAGWQAILDNFKTYSEANK